MKYEGENKDNEEEEKVDLKRECINGKLMKSMCVNVCYLIIIVILLAALVNFGLDVSQKYKEQVEVKKAEFKTCETEYVNNHCGTEHEAV